MKLQKLRAQKTRDYIEKDYDEINQMDMSDEKEYDERDQISKNDEETVTEDIEALKLRKWILQKNIDNNDREYDEIKKGYE